MNQKSISIISLLLFNLLNFNSALADEIVLRVLPVNARINENGLRVLVLEFSRAITNCSSEEVRSIVADKNNYTIHLDVPDQTGNIVPSTTIDDGIALIDRIGFDAVDINGIPNCRFLEITLSSSGFGSGTIQINNDINVQDDIIKSTDTIPWMIKDPLSSSSAPADTSFTFGLGINPNATPELTFSVSHSTSLNWQGLSDSETEDFSGNLSRWWLNLEGNIPIVVPNDVADVSGGQIAASTEVVDYINLAYRYSETNGFNLWSAGLVARTTSQFEGVEIVANYQPIQTFFDDGRGFIGLEGEAGYRTGTLEFESLTQPAPESNNFVGRIGTVVEWAPPIGPINRDLGSGLRYFVRVRGWIDIEEDARLRGFLDTELFYNFTNDARVYLRYELGTLPPDFGRSVSRFSTGVGIAF